MKKAVGQCIVALSLLFLSACGKSDADAVKSTAKEAVAKPLTKVSQVTNWFAEAEHGGQYTAMKMGYYKEAGLDMTLDPGGPQVSGLQLVASGKYQFAMASADELLIARKQGLPIVAVASVFQQGPLTIFSHKGDPISSVDKLNNRTFYVTPGIPYWEYMKKKYAPQNVKELAYTGSMAAFMANPGSVNQGYITSEGYSLKSAGFEFEAVPISKLTGYNPYTMLLVTTEKYIADQPDTVKAYVEASVKGWNYYKDHYRELNEYIHTFNPDSPLEMFQYSAEASKEYIYGGDAAVHGFGYMSEERWSTLKDQLVSIGLIDASLDVTKAYTTKFLPTK